MSRDVDSARLMSLDEKIKDLIEEGRRLGSVEANYEPEIEAKPPRPSLLSNDVSKLKEEIEEQNRKTLELQKEIKQATENFRSSMPRQNFLSNMNTNNNAASLMRPSARAGPDNYAPLYGGANSKEYLEHALEDCQEQVKYLTKRLEDSQQMAEKQKVQFRTAVEELQMRLQETIAGRKQLVQLRETENEERDEMIHKLQTTLKELAAANQTQEQSLHDADDRIQLLEKRNQATDKALERIRSIFSSHDKIKRKSQKATDSERLPEISAELIADGVERAMNDTYEEIEAMRNKIMELENGICDIKQDHEREVDMLSIKQQDVAEQLKIEMNERILEEKLNTDSAMKQVYSLQDEVQQQKFALSSKEQEVRDIEKELTVITTQFEELKSHYFDDKESLQNKLLNIEGELASTQQTNETYKHECERLKQQLSDSQEHFLRTNEELKSEREQRRNLWIKESESSKEINDLRRQLEVKVAEISSMKEKNAEMKAEHSTQLADRVREAELVERSKADRKATEFSEEITRLREELSRTKATLESTERQISDVMVERSETKQLLQDKDLQYERISSQCSQTETKLNETEEGKKRAEEKWEKLYSEYGELSQKLKKTEADYEKLKTTSNENEKQLLTLQLRYKALTSEAEKSTNELDEVKVQRLNLKADLDEKTRELQKIQNELSSSEKTISDYENRIGELIQEKNKATAQALQNEDENSRLKKSADEAEIEITEARTQISLLLDEKEELKKVKGEIEWRSKNEIERLKKQLKQVKRNLKEAEKSLMTIKSVDGRAARIAENMQKEVTDKRSLIDTLQSELSRTMDKLSYFERANKSLTSNLEEMENKFEETEQTRKSLEYELKELRKSEKGYKLAAERLGKALEKAATKNSEAHSRITQQEKDIAQLHINHNMLLINKRGPGQYSAMADKAPAGTSLYQPNVLQSGGNVAQNMLARMILNMTSRQPQFQELVSQPGLQPVMTGKSEATQVLPDTNAANDMYKVLSDVRDHLMKLEKPVETKKKRSSVKKKSRKSRHVEDSITILESESPELAVTMMTPDLSSALSASLLNSTLGSTMKDTLSESQSRQGTQQTSDDRPPSPISELLSHTSSHSRKQLYPPTPPTKKIPKRILKENTDSNSCATSDSATEISATNTEMLKNAITTTADDLCRQLQDRLEGLSRMGGKLKEQNKITERMIKKQDAKLQKVKGGMKLR